MDFCAGSHWGRFEITGRAAAGGMAEIYGARLAGPAGFLKEAALKRLKPELADDAEARRLFRREAALSSCLAHPAFPQVFDFQERDGELVLTMEFIQGTTLRRLMDGLFRKTAASPQGNGSIPALPIPLPWLAAHLARQTALALAYLWDEARSADGRLLRLVHRDISPQNLLISQGGAVRLIDMGIARSAAEPPEPGPIRGKPIYMSPEQICGLPVDTRSDLFSLGIVLYETALGLPRPLFEADTDERIREAVLRRRIVPPARFDPAFPPDLQNVVLKLLEREPADRIQTPEELAERLDQMLTRRHSARELTAAWARLVREITSVEQPASRRADSAGISIGSSEERQAKAAFPCDSRCKTVGARPLPAAHRTQARAARRKTPLHLWENRAVPGQRPDWRPLSSGESGARRMMRQPGPRRTLRPPRQAEGRLLPVLHVPLLRGASTFRQLFQSISPHWPPLGSRTAMAVTWAAAMAVTLLTLWSLSSSLEKAPNQTAAAEASSNAARQAERTPQAVIVPMPGDKKSGGPLSFEPPPS